MSDPLRLALVGASGLVGGAVLALSVGREDVRVTAVARREMKLPAGARMELFVADPDKWGEVFEAIRPTALVCALGTTWRKAGRDEAAFRAVDETLVIETGRAARAAGVERLVAVSSAGADPMSRNFYLKVKGETERELARLGFKRLDILRPGLLRGARRGDRRPAERLLVAVGPLADAFLHGGLRRYRSIRAEAVARAALALASRKAGGRFVHDNDGILRAAATLALPAADA
jgi:uncharacterized protein YbjT (DUF2867 family)